MVVGKTYAAYKKATRDVIEWILSCTIHVLDKLKSADAGAFASYETLYNDLNAHKAMSTDPKIGLVENMLTVLAEVRAGDGPPLFNARTCPSFIGSLPRVISSGFKAIRLRTKTNRFYKRSQDPTEKQSNHGHLYFLNRMKAWVGRLELLRNRTKAAASSEVHVGASHVEDECDVSGDDSDSEQGARLVDEDGTVDDIDIDEKRTEDFDDILFVLQCFMLDLDDVLKTVADAWREVRDGKSNFVSASLASLLAFRHVKALAVELEREFPSIQSFEDLEAALLHPALQTDPNRELKMDFDPDLTDKLQQYASTRVYPSRTLSIVMRIISASLLSFTTTIPSRPALLQLRVGFFGPPYDEVECPVHHVIDFRRFLLEHLPLLFNEQLFLGDFFADHAAQSDSAKFSLFKEVLDEFVTYCTQGRDQREKRTSIPLVFLTAMWYHSVQILQGGMLLSRITASTRKALRSLADSLEACVAQDRALHTAQYYRTAANKVKFLLERDASFRNHPLMAGAIALDVAVYLSLSSGMIAMGSSLSTVRALHLYNAMTRGGGLEPSPVVEKFLDVHASAFFSPARPSRNFLVSIERDAPGIVPTSVSTLYRILFMGDDTSSSLASAVKPSFAARVAQIRSLWTRELCEYPVLAFNYLAFAKALRACAEAVLALVPQVEPWNEGISFFVGMCDNRMTAAQQCRAGPLQARALSRLRDQLARRFSSPAAFDLLPRVHGSMQAALYGPLTVLRDADATADDCKLFSRVMHVLEQREKGPLSADEFAFIFTTCRDHPSVLSVHDPTVSDPLLTTGIVNHVAAGPRAHTELLECLLQLDALRYAGPVPAAHACAAGGYVAHLALVLGARNHTERDTQCARLGNTALHYAARGGQKEAILYLSRVFAAADVANKRGKTARDVAKSPAIAARIGRLDAAVAAERIRVDSRPASEARTNEARWASEAEQRRERVQRKIDERRAEKKSVRVITADEEARAKKAADELLAEEENDKAKAKGKGKRYKRSGNAARSGKGNRS